MKASEHDKNIHRTSIGGQAVIEGVMMRGPKEIATAVRKSDGEIVLDKKELPKSRSSKFVKLPIVRGCVGFFDSMILGVKSLMYSASFFELEDEEDGDASKKASEPSKFEVWLEKKLGSEKAMEYVMYISVFFSLIIGVGLFMLLPTVIVGFIKNVTENRVLASLLEGAIRIILFLIYLILVSRMKDIKRVFMYHGAEHKSIHCYEKGGELTVENVRGNSRLHPRCGTSFLLIVMVVSIITFSFISWNNPYTRLLIRLVLLPFVAGVSYEIIKFAGRHDNVFTRAISAPGMALQYITTNEPDDEQIEVAICALKAVLTDEKEDDKW